MKIYKTKFRKNAAELKEFVRTNDLELLNLWEYIRKRRKDKKEVNNGR